MNTVSWLLTILCWFLLSSCQVKQTDGSNDLFSDNRRVTNAFKIQTPEAGIYVSGEEIDIVLTFPFPVDVSTTGGIPRLTLVVGSNSRTALYSSGDGTKELTFSYTFVSGDNDTDGVVVSALSLNGGTLTFDNKGVTTNCSTTITATTFSSVLVDNTAPSITAFAETTLPGFYHVDNYITFLVTFSENVYVTGTPRIALTLDSGSVYADYFSGSGSKYLIFTYQITSTATDAGGHTITSPIATNGGTIKDLIGNNAGLGFAGFVAAAQAYNTTVMMDGTIPYVTSLKLPTNGNYTLAQNLDFEVTFNRPVTVTGTPRLELTIGATTRYANYLSGSTTSKLIFRYTTVPGDVDIDGMEIATDLKANGGTIIGTSAPTTSFFANVLNNVLIIPNTQNILINYLLPQVTSVTKNTDDSLPIGEEEPDNIWIQGQDLIITLGFNTAVNVNQLLGAPRIPITIGSTTRYATYVSGTGSASLVFSYTIQAGDLDNDGSIALGSLNLNGSIITNAAGTNTSLVISPSSLSSIYVDTSTASVSSATTTAKTLVSALEGDDTLSLILTYSRDVVVDTDGGTPYISIAAATGNVQAAYNPASSTSTQLQFDYSIDHTTDLDLDGLSLASASIQLNGATILDKISAGSATLTIGSVTNLSSVYIAPYAIVWFKGSTTNRSGFTTKPTITTTATLSSGYFNFNGTTDTMTLSSPMAATYFLYMAMKTPASGDTFPQRIMDDNLFDFTNDTIDFNSSRTVNLTTSTGFTGTGSTGYTSAFAPNTNTQVEATFPSGALVGTSPLISAEFSGDIAEIIIFEAVLSAGQASAAYDYINSAYP